MTTDKMAKTVTAGVAALTIDIAAELGGRNEVGQLVVTNRSANEVAVNCVNRTAAIDGDDCLHIPAGATRPIPYPVGNTVSYIASAAASKAEFASLARTAEFMR